MIDQVRWEDLEDRADRCPRCLHWWVSHGVLGEDGLRRVAERVFRGGATAVRLVLTRRALQDPVHGQCGVCFEPRHLQQLVVLGADELAICRDCYHAAARSAGSAAAIRSCSTWSTCCDPQGRCSRCTRNAGWNHESLTP
jgi:hypothetical protein